MKSYHWERWLNKWFDQFGKLSKKDFEYQKELLKATGHRMLPKK